jgi:hypothetical protein
MLEAMARVTPSQPNDAMARIASRRNRTISLDPNLPGQSSERFFGRRFKIVLEGPNRFEKGLGEDSGVKKDAVTHHAPVTEVRNFTFSLQRILLYPPCSAASF